LLEGISQNIAKFNIHALVIIGGFEVKRRDSRLCCLSKKPCNWWFLMFSRAAGLCGRPGAGSGQREIWGVVHSHGGYPCHRLQQHPGFWLQHRRRHRPQHHHRCQCLNNRCTHICTHTKLQNKLFLYFFYFRLATESSSLQPGLSAVCSSLRLWADTAATWPPWPVWLPGPMPPTYMRRNSALKTWRWADVRTCLSSFQYASCPFKQWRVILVDCRWTWTTFCRRWRQQ